MQTHILTPVPSGVAELCLYCVCTLDPETGNKYLHQIVETVRQELLTWELAWSHVISVSERYFKNLFFKNYLPVVMHPLVKCSWCVDTDKTVQQCSDLLSIMQ